MLHVPSYNLGLSAGIAWKNSGNDHFNPSTTSFGSKEDRFIAEIFDRSEPIKMFFPSSFFEGFAAAFFEPMHNFIDTTS